MKNIYTFYICLAFISCISFSCEYGDESGLARAADSGGQGGSLARFAISGNYLYIVSDQDLHTYDIQQAQDPLKINETRLGINIETIFPYQDLLFIGSQTGMHIYDKSDPSQPSFISRYDHVQSCDPVVVQGNYAYVTLRSGTDCRFGSNLLDVIDIQDPSSPQILNSYNMLNPHGLGVDGNRLFVCEGDFGLKIYDTSKPEAPELLEHITDLKTYDVIPRNNVLIVSGESGLFQYAYNDENTSLTLLSELK